MKLRFTTKSFIFSSFIFLLFRFLQIVLLTEAETGFLKPSLMWLDVVLTIICLVPFGYTAANTFYAFRCPNGVGKTGICGIIVGIVSGILLLVPALQSVFGGAPTLVTILLSLLGAIGCFMLAASEMFDFPLHKATFLLLLGSTLYQFITAYTVYTGKPLRVRTVYEILALVFSTLFYLYLSKAHSNVQAEKSFRLLYPLGFVAASFCFLATVPDTLALLFGVSEYVTEPCSSPFAIFGSGIFITYITLASNTYKNTKH